ncbi:unnamed protein product [Polarella glacialis]|uniref:Uncharacterized protein n=1 Tax=Polarella glacialis TaxID=89957 RepID=A0A813GV84_POLGL|nr:unnamed protein product [Polarella glacialis]
MQFLSWDNAAPFLALCVGLLYQRILYPYFSTETSDSEKPIHPTNQSSDIISDIETLRATNLQSLDDEFAKSLEKAVRHLNYVYRGGGYWSYEFALSNEFGKGLNEQHRWLESCPEAAQRGDSSCANIELATAASLAQYLAEESRSGEQGEQGVSAISRRAFQNVVGALKALAPGPHRGGQHSERLGLQLSEGKRQGDQVLMGWVLSDTGSSNYVASYMAFASSAAAAMANATAATSFIIGNTSQNQSNERWTRAAAHQAFFLPPETMTSTRYTCGFPALGLLYLARFLGREDLAAKGLGLVQNDVRRFQIDEAMDQTSPEFERLIRPLLGRRQFKEIEGNFLRDLQQLHAEKRESVKLDDAGLCISALLEARRLRQIFRAGQTAQFSFAAPGVASGKWRSAAALAAAALGPLGALAGPQQTLQNLVSDECFGDGVSIPCIKFTLVFSAFWSLRLCEGRLPTHRLQSPGPSLLCRPNQDAPRLSQLGRLRMPQDSHILEGDEPGRSIGYIPEGFLANQYMFFPDAFSAQIVLGEGRYELFELCINRSQELAIYPTIDRASQILCVEGPDANGRGRRWLIDGRDAQVPAGTVFHVTFKWGQDRKELSWNQVSETRLGMALPHRHTYYVVGSFSHPERRLTALSLADDGSDSWEGAFRIGPKGHEEFQFLRDGDLQQAVYPAMPKAASGNDSASWTTLASLARGPDELGKNRHFLVRGVPGEQV